MEHLRPPLHARGTVDAVAHVQRVGRVPDEADAEQADERGDRAREERGAERGVRRAERVRYEQVRRDRERERERERRDRQQRQRRCGGVSTARRTRGAEECSRSVLNLRRYAPAPAPVSSTTAVSSRARRAAGTNESPVSPT
jgi:hypothetical protein